MLNLPVTSVLGADPNRIHRINANSFQQHALTTINSWQYAAFYTDAINPKAPGALAVNLARRPVGRDPVNHRNLEKSKWERFAFDDYEQVMDDGHNTISIGVCKGDGTIHVAFDHHCDRLRFRISKLGIASSPESHAWSPFLFSEIQDSLPGITRNKELFEEVTYPRFVNVGDDMLLSFRIGKAGAGSDVLYHYSSSTHTYNFIGTHLTGISNNPYINGLSYSPTPTPGRLHISWTYRGFLDYIDQTEGSIAHKAQAGPNGPENNYDLYYAYSEDFGTTWKSSTGKTIAVMDQQSDDYDDGVEIDGDGSKSSEVRVAGVVGNTILPETDGIRVVEIPKGSGILNQEGQCIDGVGGVFVLNRENRSGEERWVVYWRLGGEDDDAPSTWHSTPLALTHPTPTTTGPRGSIAADASSNLWIVLQDNTSSTLYILKAAVIPITEKENGIGIRRGAEELEWVVWWSGEGFDGEPLVDEERLREGLVLSVFTRTVGHGEEGGGMGRDVVVLDFNVR